MSAPLVLLFLSSLFLVYGQCPLSLVSSSPTTSISQQGITITFGQAYTAGQYINGDWWILDEGSGVTVNSIDPPHLFQSGKYVNGFNLNPSSSEQSGFDSDVPTFNQSLWDNTLPATYFAGTSIVKSVSVGADSDRPCRPCLVRAVVFTLVSSVPENDGHTVFRPPYFGTEKTLYTKSMMDLSSLGRFDSSLLSNVSNALELSTIQDQYARVRLDHKTEYQSRQMHPRDNMPDYGSAIGVQASGAATRLLFDDVDEDSCALHNYLQSGIDLYAMMKRGVCWSPNGGHGNGRKVVVTMAAAIFHQAYPDMGPAVGDHGCWHEDGMLHRGRDGQVLWGQSSSESQYWQNVEDDSGLRTARDPYGYVDGGRRPGTSYQLCCNSQTWKGAALALCAAPSLRTIWGDDNFIIYVGRWVNCGAWAQPDACAPMQGTCQPSAGDSCTSANEETACSTSGDECETPSPGTDRGVTYGPTSGASEPTCIAGSGRFPMRHGSNQDGGGYSSAFVNEVFPALWDECVVDPCLATASVKANPDDGDDGDGGDAARAIRPPPIIV